MSEDSLPLSVYGTHLYARADLKPGQSRPNNHCLPIEEKESHRWLEGYRKACELASAAGEEVEVFSVSDRERDIYEIFEHRELLLAAAAEIGHVPPHWIVRAAKDRVLVGEDGEIGETPARLFDWAAKGTPLGIVEFSLSAKTKSRKINRMETETTTVRSRRDERQEIRISKMTPRVPRRIGGKKLAPVSYWVLSAVELDPPEGENPISWVLLTSFEIGDLEAARRILRLYLARWDIEVFHRVLKTECRVEEIQLKTEEALRPCLALYLIVAWRILYLTHLGRECPHLPCSVVFEEAEWKSVIAIAVKRKLKEAIEPEGKEPDLSRMIRLVTIFGGYPGRKNDGPPGAQSMWQGWPGCVTLRSPGKHSANDFRSSVGKPRDHEVGRQSRRWLSRIDL